MQTLPNGWRWVKLSEVCEVVMGQSPEGVSYNAEGKGEPLLNGPTEFGEMFPTAVQWTTSPTRFCQVGDILLCVRGATTGRKNLADRRYCIGRGLAAIRGQPRQAHTEFLSFALDLATEQILKEAAGSTFPNIPGAKLERVEIPLPPLSEQKRLAGILKEQMAVVERARRSAGAQLQAAEVLPAAHLRAVFNSPEAERWERKRLGEILLDVRNGVYKPEGYYGRGTRMLRMFNIGRCDGRWNLVNMDSVELTSAEQQVYCLEVGDVLVNRVNSRELVGKCAVVDESTEGAVYESKNMRVRLRKDIVFPQFVAIWLNSFDGRQQVLDRLKQIVGQATINRSDLDSLELPFPPLCDQRRIAAQLSSQMSSAERLRQRLAEQLDAINKLPPALLRRAFNGAL